MVPDHTGGAHTTTSGRMWMYLRVVTGCTTRVRYDVGGGGRLQMEWNTSSYSKNLLERLTVGRNLQPRHFFIEHFRQEVDMPCRHDRTLTKEEMLMATACASAKEKVRCSESGPLFM